MQLADGRELIYFDDDETAATTTARRHGHSRPGARPAASEIRYDAVLDEWVAIAAHRQTRTYLPPADECPLCPSARTTDRDPGARLRRGRVREPLPLVRHHRRLDGVDAAGAAAPGLRPVRGGLLHQRPRPARSPAVAGAGPRWSLDAWVDRTDRARRAARRRAGLLLREPRRGDRRHAQPPARPDLRATRSSRRGRARCSTRARHHRERTGGNLFADVLAAELADGARVVTRERALDRVRAVRGPLAVRGAPLPAPAGARPAGADATSERDDFAALYLDVLRRLDAPLRRPLPYIAAWHQAPVRDRPRPRPHLHLEVFSIRAAADKLKYLAGSESGMGAFVNDIAPERTAAMLRDALPR